MTRNFELQGRGAEARRVNILSWICVLVLAFTLAGCVGNDEESGAFSDPGGGPGTPPPPVPPPPVPPPPAPPPNDQAIFETTLYPVLRDTNNFCVNCHGVGQDPTFAVVDVSVAYTAITSQQKVDLNNPMNSRVYLRPSVDRHNCGGAVSCDVIAADVLAAIQAWANQAGANPPPPTGGAVTSAAATFADAMEGGVPRVDANAIAMFTFSEGTGDVTMDTSGVGTPIALQIEGMEWVDGGGLRNVSGKAQANAADSRKLFDMIAPVDEYTVEAWIISDNNAQDGPARIVSYSQDTAVRNFTMGQNAIYYLLRNRSAGTGVNGTPELEALDPQVATTLQHVVMTFDPASGRKVYINGQLAIEENTADTLDWLDNQTFVIGNEVTNDRLWQGIFRMVAVHNKALNGAEVQQNYDAGVGTIVTLRFDVASVVGSPAYIEMQAAQIDAAGYLFAKPVFVTDATGVAVKNIRIAVNGTVPVAAQVFRRIDTMVMQSGVELSPLGAVIPVDQGFDVDQFHLEFEVLASSMGEAEQIPPGAPPVPPADEPEPELGVRTFSQVNDTMAFLTGIGANQGAVSARYAELRDSLPPTSGLLAFAAAQQIAIQRLATTYCGELVADAASCSNFFGSCDIDGAAKDQVADALYDAFVGDNIVNQPDRVDVSAEVVRMIDDLGCANGCTGAEAQTVLQASCAAVLSSGAVMIK